MAKTKVISRDLYEKRNTDNIFLRSIIGGMLKLLNNKLVYQQVWNNSDDDIEDITIPFYYDMSNPSGERFIQDNYITFGDDCGFKQINGNFDMIPRGIISLQSAQIQGDAITNRMVQGLYQREDENGEMKSYVAFLYSIPTSVELNVEIRCSTFVEMLKIDQACKEFFYKNKTYYVLYRGMKVGCRAGFPENFMGEKQSGYTMGTYSENNDNYKIAFTITVESYQPVFDYTTEQLATNTIKAFASTTNTTTSIQESVADSGADSITYTANFNDKSDTHTNDLNNMIYIIDKYGNHTLFPSDATMCLRWDYRKEAGDMNNVKIYYTDDADPQDADNFGHAPAKKHMIAVVSNKMEYLWNIPADFTDFKGIDIIIPNNDLILVYKQPIIKVIPNPKTNTIDNDSIFVLDPGYFSFIGNPNEWDAETDRDKLEYRTHINAIISYEDNHDNLVENEIILPILNNKIELRADDHNKIAFRENISIPYKVKYTPRIIDIIIEDANNDKISCKIPCVSIV
jgi:hypothetical protein